MDFRRNTGYLGLLCFLISLVSLDANSYETRKITNNHFSKSNINAFSLNFIKNCKSKKFLRDFERHPSYPRFGKIDDWEKFCHNLINSSNAQDFIVKNLMKGTLSGDPGLLTGYYQPLIEISNHEDKEHKYPILKRKKHLMVPRGKINSLYKKEDVLYWAKSETALFFLQIQGSGIGLLDNGKLIELSYGGNNGYKYSSISKILLRQSLIEKEEISAQKIKQWLKSNPERRTEILNYNKRYIFFKVSNFDGSYPRGAAGVELVPKISIAIDSTIYPFGLPMLTKTKEKKYNLILINHDTGSAIKGKNRADLFLGRGQKAGVEAGKLIEKLNLYFLVPKVLEDK